MSGWRWTWQRNQPLDRGWNRRRAEARRIEQETIKVREGMTRQRWWAWNNWVSERLESGKDTTIPHCDSRILHAPEECEYCDRPDWTRERLKTKLTFTGRSPVDGESPCEADATRGPGTSGDHRRWGGNKPTGSEGDATWPEETLASHIMYGDKGGRAWA